MNIYTTPPAITPEVQARALEVQRYAVEHRETVRQFNNRISTRSPGPRDKEEHTLAVPLGYKVVYCVVQDATGWNQVFEISVAKPKMSPSPNAVATILGLFGLKALPGDKRGVLGQAKKVQEFPVSNLENVVNVVFPFDLHAWNERADRAATAVSA